MHRHLEAAAKLSGDREGRGSSSGLGLGHHERKSGAQTQAPLPASLAEGFTAGDRERVLELLLSQERVVSLLYAKTFPVTLKGSGGLLLEEGGGGLEGVEKGGMGNTELMGMGGGMSSGMGVLIPGISSPPRPSTSSSMYGHNVGGGAHSHPNRRPSRSSAVQGDDA